ncbi:Peptidyl-prolyl cis-trans isomerase fpr2 [Actinomortierella ambigua]|nr:Peptidyl-prolyl cis-trans isomerase fpr2 [Actinomortierella ambigua]
MHLAALVPLLVAFAVAQVSARTPPTQLQIGVKRRNPDPDCVKTKVGDRLAIQYVGKLWEDGKQFDSSWDRDQPFRFTLGNGEVIQGMDTGMRGMCLGEKRKLTIPAHLGYAGKGTPGIPPNSILVFETELVGINDLKHEEL